ncbi:PREDICTED: NADH dehydrogenase [ubiquinone] 1 beta subcomplex subunit 2, mitochondrial [Nanorana parkeri]|uniref:NADH dehydrogenase [ubiquinone] 1 beta subcomplex subunit 2, mitochondrial n=1 Tax=Nanorana parkeri TaxID=125878 RepID=UPI0008540858|nr:PREDICTED: NADH dehydrogenase [ubiquinone] 1 beta subcomplex subunit 2, mitochondrial [Nanorana parkeri]
MASLVRLGVALKAGGRLFGSAVRKQPGVRHSGGHTEPRYRQLTDVPKANVIRAELIGGLMWFWILWHFWHQPSEVFGHFPYPDPDEWTDEELGIPAEDEE